jgi:hypothetical protein
MNGDDMQKIIFILTIIAIIAFFSCTNIAQKHGSAQKLADQVMLEVPEKGFVSSQPAARWEEAMITGNGTMGALVMGNPNKEVIIFSHEKLFMPEYLPTKTPNLKIHLEKIRKLILAGKGQQAAALMVQAGKDAGIEDLIWTDPLVPACQLEIIPSGNAPVKTYAKSVNYNTGEATIAIKTNGGIIHRSIFISRPDGIAVMKINSPTGAKLNFDFSLNQLPLPEPDDEDEQAGVSELIDQVSSTVQENKLVYTTQYKKKWDGSLKGYNLTAEIISSGGEQSSDNGKITVKNAEQIIVIAAIELYNELPVKQEPLSITASHDYDKLLAKHSKIQSEMFNRFSVSIGPRSESYPTSEDLLQSSQPGKLNNQLVGKLCDAARYALISSTGEIPPTLQGIWGGTWRPAWSGDFTLNGNVPSAIACGLNANFQEVTEAYLNYMWSMMDDFRTNARGLYDADGIFVPSRTSSSGKTYHYLEYYCHLFWFAGAAWTSHFFYDYWLYTGDEKFLKERTIPFMKESLEFYKDILISDENGKYIIIPSYSPEIHPPGFHPAAINATMDVAAIKQLLRNMISLAEEGWIETGQITFWEKMIAHLPDYAIDKHGDLKEWIWPEYGSNNEHRHASHLYPLFYEVDPEFNNSPELQKAAIQAIENRMQYRREKDGAEMAFGLVQKGLAAAHLGDTAHAYECIDWLCNSYWSPSLTSYHDPGEIFNVDICGGLPAVVTEMLVQSTVDEIVLLPALPKEWPEGSIKGVRARGGFEIDMEWQNSKPVTVNVKSLSGKKSRIIFGDMVNDIDLSKGNSIILEY